MMHDSGKEKVSEPSVMSRICPSENGKGSYRLLGAAGEWRLLVRLQNSHSDHVDAPCTMVFSQIHKRFTYHCIKIESIQRLAATNTFEANTLRVTLHCFFFETMRCTYFIKKRNSWSTQQRGPWRGAKARK